MYNYLVEFSGLLYIKTKQRNRLDATEDIREVDLVFSLRILTDNITFIIL